MEPGPAFPAGLLAAGAALAAAGLLLARRRPAGGSFAPAAWLERRGLLRYLGLLLAAAGCSLAAAGCLLLWGARG